MGGLLSLEIQEMVGQRVRELRNNQGITQEALAELAGLHYSHIQRLEAGRANPTLDSLIRVSNALGVSPSQLLDTGSGRSPQIEALLGILQGRNADELGLILEITKTILNYRPGGSRLDGGVDRAINME